MTDGDSFANGRAALLAGDFQKAGVFFEDALRSRSDDAECWFLSGAVHHVEKRLDAARNAFLTAARLDGQHLQARFALATVCLLLSDSATALSACEDAVKIAPEVPNAWFNLAVAQEACGRGDLALISYGRSLSLQPGYVDALKNRGVLLLSLGHPELAVANNRTLTEKQPFSFDAQFCLGQSLLALKDYKAAANALGRAVSLSPDNVRGLLHAGFALAQCERFGEAQAFLDRAVLRDPAQVLEYRRSIFGNDLEDGSARLDARTLFLLRHYDAIEACNWRERDHFLERFSALIRHPEGAPLDERALAFRAMALGLDPALQLSLARQIAARFLHTAEQIAPWSLAQRAAFRPEPPAGRKRGRLRIAYLSGDFRRHATAYLMSRLPALHDRERFEVFLYSTGPDDGSEIRASIIAGADCFRDVRHLSDAALAQAIAADEVDILVDLAGYTQYSRPVVLALRAAPLQVSYLVYLQTSGAPWIDYALLDRQVLKPGMRAFWSEKIAFLPHTLYICNDRSVDSGGAASRADEGLPEDAFVFCCLNAPWKIDPETFACWVRILERVPRAVLWVYADKDAAEINLREAFRNAGVGDHRIIFARNVSHEQHLARFRHADVFLDTFVCNAHTTAIEALAAGVPVVTLPGESVVARVGSSLLAAHGLEMLVARTVGDYIETACRLAQAPECLLAVKSRVQNFAASRLFATAARVQEIERAYEIMWARHQAGLVAEDFDVPASTGEFAT